MQFDDDQVDASQLEDRRGGGGGGFGLPGIAIGGGGLGIVGVIIVLALQLLGGGGGGSSFVLPEDQQGAVASSDVAQRCTTQGAVDKYDDCYVLKVFNEVNEVWTGSLRGYQRPTLVYFDGATQTGCGAASSQVGPFYCPADRRVYLDLGFLRQLQDQFGAQGRYAQAYIVAHEVGHHLQNLTGTERRVRALQQRDPEQTNALSVRLELQADCYAGVWGALANRQGNVAITDAELDQALHAAEAVGDDRIQAKVQGRVNPETWTHGSAEQRRGSFLRGFRSPALESCDTFQGAA